MAARRCMAVALFVMWQPCGSFQPGNIAAHPAGSAGVWRWAPAPHKDCVLLPATGGHHALAPQAARLRARTQLSFRPAVVRTAKKDSGDVVGEEAGAAPQAEEDGVTVKAVIGKMGLIRLGVLGAVLLWLLAQTVSLLSSPAMLLPPPLAGNWAVQELVFSEVVFAVGSKLYLDGIAARYAGHAQWSLPLPIPASAESFINLVLFTGVLVPITLAFSCASTSVAPAVILGAFGPYFSGLCVQLLAWRTMGFRNSVVWPLVPLPFTAWRLGQLARSLQWLAAVGAPAYVQAAFSYFLIPAWALILLGHLYMLPTLLRWPLRDDSLVTAIGPVPAKPLEAAEDEGDRVLDQIGKLSVQAEKLRIRANLLRKMQVGNR